MNIPDDYFRRMRAGDGADWRSNRVGTLLFFNEQPDDLDDPATIDLHEYRRNRASPGGGSGPREAVTVLSRVHEIHEENSRQRWEIEARLLAGATPAEVAAVTGIDAAVVDTYVSTYFDVVGHLNAHDWIVVYAMDVGFWTEREPTEGEIWRYVAWSGGREALELLMDDYADKSVDTKLHQLAEDLRTIVRFTCMPLTNTRLFARVMQDMYRVLATRNTVLTSQQWHELARDLESLEIAAGLRSAGKMKGRRSSKSRGSKTQQTPQASKKAAGEAEGHDTPPEGSCPAVPDTEPLRWSGPVAMAGESTAEYLGEMTGSGAGTGVDVMSMAGAPGARVSCGSGG